MVSVNQQIDICSCKTPITASPFLTRQVEVELTTVENSRRMECNFGHRDTKVIVDIVTVAATSILAQTVFIIYFLLAPTHNKHPYPEP